MMEGARVAVKRQLGQAWYGLFERTHRPPAHGPERTVLLLRADGIGDLLFSLPLVETIRRSESPRRTILLCDHGAESFIRSLGVVDVVIPFERLRYRWDPLYRWKLWKILRRLRAELAISLQYHRSPTSDELLLASGAAHTVALSGNNEMISERDRRRFNARFDHVIDVPDHVPERQRYEILARAQGWPAVDWDRTYELFRDRCESHGASTVRRSTRVVALAPGGSSALRRWSDGQWLELIERLSASTKATCLLVGGPSDRSMIRRLSKKAEGTASIAIGSDVLSVARMIVRSDVVVGIDSGISHLAARLGIPCVVVLGGGHFVRYFPYASATSCFAPQDCYECNWQCHRDRVYCLMEISPVSVEQEVRRHLDRTDRPRHG